MKFAWLRCLPTPAGPCPTWLTGRMRRSRRWLTRASSPAWSSSSTRASSPSWPPHSAHSVGAHQFLFLLCKARDLRSTHFRLRICKIRLKIYKKNCGSGQRTSFAQSETLNRFIFGRNWALALVVKVSYTVEHYCNLYFIFYKPPNKPSIGNLFTQNLLNIPDETR